MTTAKVAASLLRSRASREWAAKLGFAAATQIGHPERSDEGAQSKDRGGGSGKRGAVTSGEHPEEVTSEVAAKNGCSLVAGLKVIFTLPLLSGGGYRVLRLRPADHLRPRRTALRMTLLITCPRHLAGSSGTRGTGPPAAGPDSR